MQSIKIISNLLVPSMYPYTFSQHSKLAVPIRVRAVVANSRGNHWRRRPSTISGELQGREMHP